MRAGHGAQVIAKPFRPRELLAVIERVLARGASPARYLSQRGKEISMPRANPASVVA